MSENNAKYSALVEIAKCSGDLKRNYGANRGALLTLLLAYMITRPVRVMGLASAIVLSSPLWAAKLSWFGWAARLLHN
ncbi:MULTISPECIES: hypothetical protein [unclassified Bradyrhizobium]|uniref:hypothetical protein n=1 Tax=unclassified Bradyrhizobium TaxID=2631580 RepID=UPI0028EFACDB|nr:MULTISPECIES: hypothetical protein [unclassified Bradyrhizobium]